MDQSKNVTVRTYHKLSRDQNGHIFAKSCHQKMPKRAKVQMTRAQTTLEASNINLVTYLTIQKLQYICTTYRKCKRDFYDLIGEVNLSNYFSYCDRISLKEIRPGGFYVLMTSLKIVSTYNLQTL